MSAFQLFLKLGFKLAMGLGLGLGSVLATTMALAAPAPVFEPILDDIAGDRTVRLPTTVPSDVELYPSVMEHFGMVILYLSPEPDCDDSACRVLTIIKTVEPPYWPPENEDPNATVDLGNDVQGYSWGNQGIGSVQWIQDGWLYALGYDEAIFSEAEAIAMATSMASQSLGTP